MATLATSIGRGTLAARPATMPAGSLYFVTDTSTLYRSNGSTWDAVEAAAGASTLDALSDVNAPSPADGNVLTWDATPGEWVPTTPVAGYTAENARDDIAAALVAGTNITITPNDAGDTITIASTGGASATTGAVLPWITGRYYDISQIFTPANAVANHAFPTGFLGFQPIYVPTATSVDRIGLYVNSGVATAVARIGVYAVASTGWPGALEFAAPTTLDISSSGGKEATISQTLAAGWHYIAFTVSTGTPTFMGWATTALVPQLYGQTSLTNTATQNPLQYVTFTYAALPDPFPALTGLTSFSGIIRLALRKA